jgi:hypothetical protein
MEMGDGQNNKVLEAFGHESKISKTIIGCKIRIRKLDLIRILHRKLEQA